MIFQFVVTLDYALGVDMTRMFTGGQTKPTLMFVPTSGEEGSVGYYVGSDSSTAYFASFEGEGIAYSPGRDDFSGYVGSIAWQRSTGPNPDDVVNYAHMSVDLAGLSKNQVSMASAVNVSPDSLMDAAFNLAQASGARMALTVFGTPGADNVVGSDYSDNLYGGDGRDTMTGFGGDDTYGVGSADDVILEQLGGGNDMVIATVSYTLSENIETLSMSSGTDPQDATGNKSDNFIYGNAGANVIDGKRGSDLMEGKGGNDTYGYDNYGDIIHEAVDGGIDTVLSSKHLFLFENIENGTLIGKKKLDLVGNELANRLDGNKASNYLSGADGADTFVFDDKLGSKNVDRITDFSRKEGDRIELESDIFFGLRPNRVVAESAFKNIAEDDVDRGDRILYDQRNGWLYYDQDGKGGRDAVHFATLKAGTAIDHDNFFVA
jgi:Ca2+-binding RTX toxin-like protein